MSYGNVLVTDATVEPVDESDCRRQCNLADANHAHDAWFRIAIPAARKLVEDLSGRSLINKTFDLKLDAFPTGDCPIYIPHSPLSSVTSITYTDAAGDSQTLATSVYKVSTSREPGEISLKYGQVWPVVYGENDVIAVRYVAGYGATAASVAADKKAPILILISHWFDNRGIVSLGTISPEIGFTFMSLINAIKVGDEFHSYAPV